jgi:hypothetical protein
MRAEANERGTIESGFKRAEDGWHVVRFLEGIEELKNKEGEMVVNKGGDQLWKVPLVVDDDTDISHETEIDSIAAENAKGEQLISDFLGATGLYAAFAKAFPGDVSVFESKCMGKVKTKLPGQFIRIKTKQNGYKDKAGNEQIAVNIIGFGKMSDTVDDLEGKLFPGKAGAGAGAAKKEAKKEAPVANDDDF